MIDVEIWKDIEGFDGVYKISNTGYVKSTRNTIGRKIVGEHILKGRLDVYGYKRVHLRYKNISKEYAVHRLVAQAFIPNPENLPTVNHKDEKKLNNNVSNLEWMTFEDNNNYGSKHRRTSLSHRKRAKTIYQFTKEGVLVNTFPSPAEASEQTGIKRGNILSCVLGLTSDGVHVRKTAGGYIWSYNKNLSINDRTRQQGMVPL